MVKGSFAAYRALDEDKRYILAGRVAAGSLFGATLFDVPPQRRFYVGGGGSLRAMPTSLRARAICRATSSVGAPTSKRPLNCARR